MLALAFAEDGNPVPVTVFDPLSVIAFAAVVRADRDKRDFRPCVDLADAPDDFKLGEIDRSCSSSAGLGWA